MLFSFLLQPNMFPPVTPNFLRHPSTCYILHAIPPIRHYLLPHLTILTPPSHPISSPFPPHPNMLHSNIYTLLPLPISLYVHVCTSSHPSYTGQCRTPISTLSCITLSPTLSHHNLYHSALQPLPL